MDLCGISLIIYAIAGYPVKTLNRSPLRHGATDHLSARRHLGRFLDMRVWLLEAPRRDGGHLFTPLPQLSRQFKPGPAAASSFFVSQRPSRSRTVPRSKRRLRPPDYGDGSGCNCQARKRRTRRRKSDPDARFGYALPSPPVAVQAGARCLKSTCKMLSQELLQVLLH